MEWVKVEDRMPDTLQNFLHVLTYSPANGFVTTSYYKKAKGYFVGELGLNSDIVVGVTHWSYMPEKPEKT